MKFLAQFGNIENPFGPSRLNGPAALSGSTQGQGLISILNTLLRTAILFAGIYTLFNIIIAGYGFLSAGGDAKKVTQAWEKIYMSLIGLLFVAGSLVLAGIFGYLVFGDASAIIAPRVYSPQ